MKNIHVLPTDKPSRLIKTQDNNFIKLNTNVPNWFEINLNTKKQNIYITNDEEIKEGDYYIDFTSNGIKIEHFKTKDDWVLVGICGSKKIILTTDQDLIADSVQAIDDEFLEWFVNNPSCEFVEIDNRLKISSTQKGFVMDNPNYKKIIIPKEESKQEIQLKDPNTCEHFKELGCIKDICTCYTLVSKQETLEEVAENYINKQLFDFGDLTHVAEHQAKQAFKNGYKLAQQQNKNLYSEEDMQLAHKVGAMFAYGRKEATKKDREHNFNEWFNQFKKK